MVAQNVSTSASTASTSTGSIQNMASPSTAPIQQASSVPAVPPGFTLVSSQTQYILISAMPYGVSSFNAFDPNMPMTGFLAGRGTPRFNGGRNNYASNGNNGLNFLGRGNAGFPNNNAGLLNNNAGFRNPIIYQIYGENGHVARTCRSISNVLNQQQGIFNQNSGGCQVCGRFNHTAERCYHIIGFPNQQPQTSTQAMTPQQNGMMAGNAGMMLGNAMLAAATQAPQYWLADTGATNHMTNEVQLLNNVAPYPHTDAVQVGQ
ncbi:uncharacterized protein LOC121049575 [Rosa chinensis]|uniref:uncharacterized protein LOC121049575 n=1 Tax=Rosa chinensis TaxID=74649 RepID=UPI001AD945B6|nr:uncharacterized protein LOC121049575 [Rosa chinensis]XP_040363262.1 uncharacterized protein LOC121049575 [Rosa chinensis]XP_040363263.1 uncharacterized protein LOC121049575 [Rosa chinensis]XP_040363264.1 uncharacterized protein LOC121049575 [Rosa chinensis]